MSFQLQLPTGVPSSGEVRAVPALKAFGPASSIQRLREDVQSGLRTQWEETHINDENVRRNTLWKPCKVGSKKDRLDGVTRSVFWSLAQSIKGSVFTFEKEYDISKYQKDGSPLQAIKNISLGDKLICHGDHQVVEEVRPQGWATDVKDRRRGRILWWFSRQQDPKSQGYLLTESVTFEPTPEAPHEPTSTELKKLEQARKAQETAENRKRKREEKELQKQQNRGCRRRRPNISAPLHGTGTMEDPLSFDDTEQMSLVRKRSSGLTSQPQDDAALSSQASPAAPQSSPPSSPEPLPRDLSSSLFNDIDIETLHTFDFDATKFHPAIDSYVDLIVDDHRVKLESGQFRPGHKGPTFATWRSYRTLVREVTELLDMEE